MLVIVGPAVTLRWGLLPVVLALLVALWIGRQRALKSVERGGVEGLSRWLKRAIAGALLPITAVLALVAARVLAAVVIAFPASLWVLGLALVIAAIGPLSGRFRVFFLMLSVALVPILSGVGARFEAGAVDARGAAISGPILGIHPFQTTAIVIDGYGPFDLPFNDYVEPGSERGYGPEEYADAFERALHRIAELQFADGPARAYEAFAQATVEAIEVPAVPERLDRPKPETSEPRIRITSGSSGQRSRVELVCPGMRVDPRGLQADPVMERMCPDHYAAEGSAGLGLTGRWTGYSEIRGNERLGFGRLFGRTRADDLRGWRSVLKESKVLAFLLVLLALLGLAGGRRRQQAGSLLSSWAVWVLAAAAVLTVIAIAFAGQLPVVGVIERPAAGSDLWGVAEWLPVWVIGCGFAELVAFASAPGGGAGPRLPSLLWPAIGVVIGTLGVASWLASSAWVVPDLWPHLGQGSGAGSHLLPMQRWIIEVGGGLHRLCGCELDVAEAMVAGAVVAAMVGVLAAISEIFAGLSQKLVPRLARFAVLAPLGIAAGLVVSKQTHGGALLVAPALALTALIVAVLAVARDRRPRPWGPGLILLFTALITLWSLNDALRQTTRSGPFLDVCVALGGLLVAALVVAAWARPRRSGP